MENYVNHSLIGCKTIIFRLSEVEYFTEMKLIQFLWMTILATSTFAIIREIGYFLSSLSMDYACWIKKGTHFVTVTTYITYPTIIYRKKFSNIDCPYLDRPLAAFSFMTNRISNYKWKWSWTSLSPIITSKVCLISPLTTTKNGHF